MKLAEALLIRADLQKKTASLKERLVANAVVQEGDRPSEDTNALLGELTRILDELEKLIATINKANLEARIKTGLTLTDALAKRDVLAQRHSILTAIVEATSPQGRFRYGTSEIRWLPQLNAAELHKQADEVAKQLRELNAAIQEAGWNFNI